MRSQLFPTFTMLLTVLLSAVLIATVGPSAGCSSMPQVAPPVEPERAIRVLDATLTAWKDGTAITAVSEASEPVVVQDFDWLQGRGLADFERLDEGVSQDANLRVSVRLTFADPPEEKTVAYIVGTGPKLTVFRAFE
jgi:hypothetical protein